MPICDSRGVCVGAKRKLSPRPCALSPLAKRSPTLLAPSGDCWERPEAFSETMSRFGEMPSHSITEPGVSPGSSFGKRRSLGGTSGGHVESPPPGGPGPGHGGNAVDLSPSSRLERRSRQPFGSGEGGAAGGSGSKSGMASPHAKQQSLAGGSENSPPPPVASIEGGGSTARVGLPLQYRSSPRVGESGDGGSPSRVDDGSANEEARGSGIISGGSSSSSSSGSGNNRVWSSSGALMGRGGGIEASSPLSGVARSIFPSSPSGGIYHLGGGGRAGSAVSGSVGGGFFTKPGYRYTPDDGSGGGLGLSCGGDLGKPRLSRGLGGAANGVGLLGSSGDKASSLPIRPRPRASPLPALTSPSWASAAPRPPHRMLSPSPSPYKPPQVARQVTRSPIVTDSSSSSPSAPAKGVRRGGFDSPLPMPPALHFTTPPAASRADARAATVASHSFSAVNSDVDSLTSESLFLNQMYTQNRMRVLATTAGGFNYVPSPLSRCIGRAKVYTPSSFAGGRSDVGTPGDGFGGRGQLAFFPLGSGIAINQEKSKAVSRRHLEQHFAEARALQNLDAVAAAGPVARRAAAEARAAKVRSARERAEREELRFAEAEAERARRMRRSLPQSGGDGQPSAKIGPVGFGFGFGNRARVRTASADVATVMGNSVKTPRAASPILTEAWQQGDQDADRERAETPRLSNLFPTLCGSQIDAEGEVLIPMPTGRCDGQATEHVDDLGIFSPASPPPDPVYDSGSRYHDVGQPLPPVRTASSEGVEVTPPRELDSGNGSNYDGPCVAKVGPDLVQRSLTPRRSGRCHGRPLDDDEHERDRERLRHLRAMDVSDMSSVSYSTGATDSTNRSEYDGIARALAEAVMEGATSEKGANGALSPGTATTSHVVGPVASPWSTTTSSSDCVKRRGGSHPTPRTGQRQRQ